jgi:hypothetical protein
MATSTGIGDPSLMADDPSTVEETGVPLSSAFWHLPGVPICAPMQT